MSRIGKKIIELPAGVSISVGSDNVVTVKGPKGELKQEVDRDIIIDINNNIVEIKRPTDQIRHRAMHGLYRALINNLVQGVTVGFKKELELVGVGFKAASEGNLLDLALGYSHNIIFEIPSELKVTTSQQKA
jgi:large subunit ribosomal protein L6